MSCLSTTEQTEVCPKCKERFTFTSNNVVKQELNNSKIGYPRGLYYVTCSKCNTDLGFTYRSRANKDRCFFVINPLIKRKYGV